MVMGYKMVKMIKFIVGWWEVHTWNENDNSLVNPKDNAFNTK